MKPVGKKTGNTKANRPILSPLLEKKPEDIASGFLKKYVSFGKHHLTAPLPTAKVRHAQTLHSSAGTVSWPNTYIIAITTGPASNE